MIVASSYTQLVRNAIRKGRIQRNAVALAFIVVVTAQAAAHIGAVSEGRPYETWDEIAAFNTVRVVNTADAALRTYRYGSMDSFMQWLAMEGYSYFDKVGPTTDHIHYSNNVPSSLNDRFIAFRPKTWSGLDYSAFRGADDREPIFISRYIHLIFGYFILSVIGFLVILAYGATASFLFVPLLWLSVSPEQYYQMAQSLPNSINAVLAFGSVLFAMIFCDQFRTLYLLISVACLALGLNFKPDIVVIAIAPVLALAFTGLEKGFNVGFSAAWRSLVIFLAATIVTRPLILLAPLQDLRIRYHVLLDAAGSSEPEYSLANNLGLLLEFIKTSLAGNGIASELVLAVTGVIVIAALATKPERARTYRILAIGLFAALAAWGAVVLKGPNIADRYFLNGLASLLATFGMALLLINRSPVSWRLVARFAIATIGGLYAVNAVGQAKSSIAILQNQTTLSGFDSRHHRNLASAEAIKLIHAGGHEQVILVDQHGYIDLRAFRLQGIEARYVNMFDFGEVVCSLKLPGKYLVLFSRGTYDKVRGYYRDWMGDWTPDLRRLYDEYQGRLLALPVARHYPGKPQLVLSAAPVEPADDIYLSVLTIGQPKTATGGC